MPTLRRRQFLRNLSLTTALTTGGLAGSAAEATPSTPAAGELRVMSYNLRYAAAQGANHWPGRLPRMRQLWEQQNPDVVGTQEGLYTQLRELGAELPAYDWIGTGRDGGSRGEFMAVFYRRDRLEPLEYDHFWLSDTPLVIGSSTWGNSNRRMVTWIRFRDRQTRREFAFWNTHLDHQLQPAREKSAALILERLAKVSSELPVLLVGDFNADATYNRVYDLLVKDGGLADTWFTAQVRREADANTFNNFAPLVRNGRRIDWILSRGPVAVRSSEVITTQPDGQWPSDHCPILSVVQLGVPA
jgi:endonuclease/exonuclease/phosphatase family metal-dependent hydrolase